MSLDFSQIVSSIGRMSTHYADAVEDFSSDTTNLDSTDGMLQLQMLVQQWTLAVNLQTTITKTLSDSLSGIIQKF